MPRTCSIKGCDGKHQAKGLCWKHYQRLRRTGSVDDPDYPNKGKECLIKGCNEDATSKGMCGAHHMRTIRHGSPTIVLKKRKGRSY